MKKYILALLAVASIGYSQTSVDSTKAKQLEEVFIATPKYLKNKKFISQKIENISQKEIEFQNFQNTADALMNSGNVNVQKSQQGGGSPVIRGFEANRILILVDGIRMNNLIFRGGHLQNSITVDENMLENIDLSYGASSTLFGSDALGGAINLTTKKAQFSSNGKSFSGNVLSRYSSVNEEKSGHFDFNYGTSNFASLTSFSYNDFGDLRMGKRKNHHNPYFGERDFYVQNVNGGDQLIANDNKYIQRFTAYKQYDFMLKFAYKQANGNLHSLNFQYSTSTDIPRYDRLTDPSSSTGLRNAEWYYGPQKRLLGVYNFSKNKFILNSDLSLDISYQNVEESRHNRRFGNYNLQNRTEKVILYGINATLKKAFLKSELQYGIETYLDNLNSSAFSNNINTGETVTIDSRYPNGNNSMFRSDFFITYNETISPKTNWNIGGRIGYTSLKSSISDNSFFQLPFDTIEQNNFTYSANVGIIHKTSNTVSLIANLSSGFRVPNIDDLAKVFETVDGILIVPNENLKPEKTITADLGYRITNQNKRFEWENNYFYTRFIDAIVTDVFTYNGSSTIDYNGSLSQVFANQNKGKAFITGISSALKTFVVNNLLFTATFNYTLGRIIEDNEKLPLDHIAPFYGKIGFNYTKKQYGLEVYMLYNGKKDIKNYLLNGEDNEQYAPPGGMPAWETYNAKGSVVLFKNATLFVGVENILDTQYRTFASGMNAPGRNLYSGLKYSF
jgi:hemoglobin/transferrin/lactoferrin receptor protein